MSYGQYKERQRQARNAVQRRWPVYELMRQLTHWALAPVDAEAGLEEHADGAGAGGAAGQGSAATLAHSHSSVSARSARALPPEGRKIDYGSSYDPKNRPAAARATLAPAVASDTLGESGGREAGAPMPAPRAAAKSRPEAPPVPASLSRVKVLVI